MGKFSGKAASWAILALAALFLAFGCSEENVQNDGSTREFVEGTLSEPEEPPGTIPEAATTTAGVTSAQPDAVLRLEGDTKVAFSGVCTSESQESVIAGGVPKLYRFELRGRELSCRIQKRDPGNGNLRVTLLAGEDTRSVQQTNSPEGVIRLSYSGS